jgi:hypothetical protein
MIPLLIGLIPHYDCLMVIYVTSIEKIIEKRGPHTAPHLYDTTTKGKQKGSLVDHEVSFMTKAVTTERKLVVSSQNAWIISSHVTSP